MKYYESLKKLNSKMRSELELRKLLENKSSSSIINDIINRLKKDGYLNRKVYIN